MTSRRVSVFTMALQSGFSVKKDLEKDSGEIPYVKVADMSHPGNEQAIRSSSRFLDNVSDKQIIPVGTTIFPKRGGAIMTNKKRITEVPICADLNVMGVIPPSELDPNFLYFYFLNVDMKQLGSGTTIPQINNYDIAPLKISYPPSVGAQQDIVGELAKVREQAGGLASIYQQKLDALAELKQSILQKAFAGELTADMNHEELVN